MIEKRDTSKQNNARKAMIRACRNINPVCPLCGHVIDLKLDKENMWSVELDHIVPLSRGGGWGSGNLQLVHKKCNRIKQDRSLENIIYKGFSRSGCDV